jgi:hypothetical protein
VIIRIDVMSEAINDGLSRTIRALLEDFVVVAGGCVDVADAVDEAVVNVVNVDGEV